MTIGFCTNRKSLTLQVKKHEFTPVLPDFLIKCTKPHTRCRTIASCGRSKFQLSFPRQYNRAGARQVFFAKTNTFLSICQS